MRIINVTEVVVPEQRTRSQITNTDLIDLMESIASPTGLLHAPVLRKEGDQFVLVAGENRLRAIQRLSVANIGVVYDRVRLAPGELPYVLLGEDLSEAEYLAAELEENLRRSKLSWQDQVRGEARLHEMLSRLNPTQTLTDTASRLNQAPASASDVYTLNTHIRLVDYLDDPEVAKANTPKDAVKIVRMKEESKLRQELAGRISNTIQNYTLLHGDCRNKLPEIPVQSISCVVVDPPYGIDAQDLVPQSSTQVAAKHNYDDSLANALSIVTSIATADCLATDCHVWCFADIRNYPDFAAIFENAGWTVWHFPLIWSRRLGSLLGNANGPRHTYDVILFAQRGERRILKVFDDVLNFQQDTTKVHAAQKPIELYKFLLSVSALPGETVLDACCGRGTIFPAAAAVKCKAVGIEKDDDSHALAKIAMHECVYGATAQ